MSNRKMSKIVLFVCLFLTLKCAHGVNWATRTSSDIYDLCLMNGSVCLTQPVGCLSAPPSQTDCKIIAGFTNFDVGLSIANPDKYDKRKAQVKKVNEQSSITGIFLFGQYDPSYNDPVSVGLVTSGYRIEHEHGGELFVCTLNDNKVISTLWQLAEKMKISMLHDTIVEIVNVPTSYQAYFACSWPLNLKNSKFQAQIAQVNVNNFNSGPRPLRTENVKLNKVIGKKIHVKFDEMGFAFNTNNSCHKVTLVYFNLALISCLTLSIILPKGLLKM